jgi:hypothetical protein
MTTSSGRGESTRESRQCNVRHIALGFALVALASPAGCNRSTRSPAAISDQPSTTHARDDLAIQPWPLPVQTAGQHDLVASPDGSLLLSWVEENHGSQAFRFSRYRAGTWTAPVTISSGDWFGNSSDTPHLRQTADGALWATWLRKTPGAGHARDIVLARSSDGGETWSKPVSVNEDTTPTEHGFVSTWAQGPRSLGIAWLDGRAKAHAHSTSDRSHDHGDATTMLRAVRFDEHLQRSGEAVIDTATCDCCNTDVAATRDGPVLVYRDRTPGEVRDIAITRLQAGSWKRPAVVFPDGWVMPACPMNGPAVAANDAVIATGWYTAPDQTPTIRFALSHDGGAHFSTPLEIDRGPAVQGRVDLTLEGMTPWVTWLREDGTGQSLWLARLGMDGAAMEQRVQVARVSGRGRGTGMPRILAADGDVFLVWTDVVAGESKLQGRMLNTRCPRSFAGAR